MKTSEAKKLGILYSRELKGKQDTLEHGVNSFGFLLKHGTTSFNEFADMIEGHCEHTGAKLIAHTLREFEGTVIKDHFSVTFNY